MRDAVIEVADKVWGSDMNGVVNCLKSRKLHRGSGAAVEGWRLSRCLPFGGKEHFRESQEHTAKAQRQEIIWSGRNVMVYSGSTRYSWNIGF